MIGILTGSSTAGRRDCRLVGGDGEREFCDEIRQQGMNGGHSVAHWVSDRWYVGGSPSRRPIIMDPYTDHVTTVNVSVKDQLTLSSAVAVGSTIVSNCFVFA